MAFGEYLKEKRKAAHVTQRNLASQVGIDHTYISKLEHNALDHTPSVKTLQRIAQVLHVNEEEMILQAGKDISYKSLAERYHRSLNTIIALFVDHKAYGEYTCLDDAFDLLAEGYERLGL